MAASDCLPCHLCGHDDVVPVSGFEKFRRVTSDCKPWAAGGWLGVCHACGGVQKRMDARWREEIEQVYREYTIYHQSGGSEQPVFSAVTGQSQARSERIVARLVQSQPMRSAGRLLDVGCGNGAFLRACSKSLPGWELLGTEINDKYKAEVESIPGVSVLHVGEAAGMPGEFDVISLVHVLEHVPSPVEFLTSLRTKLTAEGSLIVEVPHFMDNPFDLLIVDHSTHFSAEVLRGVAERSGYASRVLATDWVAKELTLVAEPAEKGAAVGENIFDRVWTDLQKRLEWLASIARLTRELPKSGRLGIFGTSIAAMWLFGELDGSVDYFVDEDPDRVGRTCFGKPVLAPSQVPSRGRVCMALPSTLAEQVKTRLQNQGLDLEFHIPPLLS